MSRDEQTKWFRKENRQEQSLELTDFLTFNIPDYKKHISLQ